MEQKKIDTLILNNKDTYKLSVDTETLGLKDFCINNDSKITWNDLDAIVKKGILKEANPETGDIYPLTYELICNKFPDYTLRIISNNIVYQKGEISHILVTKNYLDDLLANYLDLTAIENKYVAKDSLKRINGQSIIGVGDITITGGITELGVKNIIDTLDLVKTSDLDTYLTTDDAINLYQPKGNYLTQVPDNYVKKDELDDKQDKLSKEQLGNINKDHSKYLIFVESDTDSVTFKLPNGTTFKAALYLEPATPTYTITVSAGLGGTVSGSGTYNYGTQQTITATPEAHYHFVQWSDGNTDASRQITVNGNATYTATFAIDQHTITVQTNNNNYGTVSGSGTFDYNSSKTITATPKTGYHFVKWNDGNTDASRSITVTEDKTYTATFAVNLYIVTVTTNNSNYGIVTGGGTYEYRSTVTLEANPNGNCEFKGWYKDDTLVSTESPYTFEVTENITIDAIFEQNALELPNNIIYYGTGGRDFLSEVETLDVTTGTAKNDMEPLPLTSDTVSYRWVAVPDGIQLAAWVTEDNDNITDQIDSIVNGNYTIYYYGMRQAYKNVYKVTFK